MSDSEDRRRTVSWRRGDDAGTRRRTRGRLDRRSLSPRLGRRRSLSRSSSLSGRDPRSSSPSWSSSPSSSMSSGRRRTPSRSPSRSRRNRSLSPTPPRHQNDHHAEVEDQQDRRVRDRSPDNRRRRRSDRSRSPSHDRRALKIIDRSRSPSRRQRRDRRSCRSRSRTRSDECEDRRCCVPRQGEDEDEEYMSHEEEDFFVRIDRYDRLFTCAQCRTLLSSPVYECTEGHVTCGSCHEKSNADREDGEQACRRCGERNYGRSRAAAEWLRSVRFPCCNYRHGCPAYRPRHAIDAHERACRHAPCFCPVRRCGFPGGPAAELERHLADDHGWAAVAFCYGQPFHVPVRAHVLRAEDDGELFYLHAEWTRRATALSMVRVRPDRAAADEAEFTYEVKTPQVEGVPQRLQMQATVWGTSLEYGRENADQVCVTVPDFMFPQDDQEADSVEVRVDKIVPAPAS